jgi:exodeoxyribonuclease VII small subunit
MPKKAKTNQINKIQQWNYEATVANLELIVQEIESGNLELAEVFDKFAWAVEALKDCEDFLAEKQGQMNILIETLEEESEF